MARVSAPGPPFPLSVAEGRRALRPAFRIGRGFAPLRAAGGRPGGEMVLARRTSA